MKGPASPKPGTIQEHARGVTVSAAVRKTAAVAARVCSRCPDGCVSYKLQGGPKRIGVATANMDVQTAHPIDDEVCHGQWLPFGQDLLHSYDRAAPDGKSVHPLLGAEVDAEGVLRDDMRKLAGIFDWTSGGKSRRLIEAFLSKKPQVELYTDPDLDAAVKANENFHDFATGCIGVRQPPGQVPKTRIHQSLKAAGWDVNRAQLVTDLGPPAFYHAKDFVTGLKLMINGVQHVMVDVESYEYVSCRRSYKIGLRFALYDVFGLDDEDLRTFGTNRRVFSLDAQVGFTAWWQLQHQEDYAPLITRALVRETYRVETRGT